MKCALDGPESTFNKHEKEICAHIRKSGWFGTHVGADKDKRVPSFSYTTGLWKTLDAPELITFGLPHQVAHDLFWILHDRVKAGSGLPVALHIPDVSKGFDIQLMPVRVEHRRKYLLSSRWFYGCDDFPCLQLVWPDPENIFPWEPSFNERFRNDQPDLSDAGWKTLAAGKA